MNLGPRCIAMLSNQCQCPNTSLVGSDYCGLHNKVEPAMQPQINDKVTPVINTNPDGIKQE